MEYLVSRQFRLQVRESLRDDLLQEYDISGLLLEDLGHGLGPLLQVVLVEAVDVPGDEHQTPRGLGGHQTLVQGWDRDRVS